MDKLLYLLASIIGGVSVFLITQSLTRRRLYMVVPKLFNFSELSDDGKVIEFSIINRGSRTEDDILVKLSPGLFCTLLASNDPSLEIVNGEVKISRLSGGDEVSAVLLVEGGEFSKETVASFSSKECKGKLVENTKDSLKSNPSGTMRGIATLITICIFSCIGFWYGVLASETGLWYKLYDKNVPSSVAKSGWNDAGEFLSTKYYQHSSSKTFPCDMKAYSYEDELLTVTYLLKNDAKHRVEFTLNLASTNRNVKSNLDEDTFETNILVFPLQTTEKSLSIFLAKDANPRLAVVECMFQYPGDIYESYSQDLVP